MFLYMKDIDLLCMRRIFVLLFVLMTCGFIFAKSSINEKKSMLIEAQEKIIKLMEERK